MNIPFQMILIIFLGVILGKKLDAYFNNEFLFTVIFSLVSVFIALYMVICNVNNINKND